MDDATVEDTIDHNTSNVNTKTHVYREESPDLQSVVSQNKYRPQELFSLKKDNIIVLVQLLNNLISK